MTSLSAVHCPPPLIPPSFSDFTHEIRLLGGRRRVHLCSESARAQTFLDIFHCDFSLKKSLPKTDPIVDGAQLLDLNGVGLQTFNLKGRTYDQSCKKKYPQEKGIPRDTDFDFCNATFLVRSFDCRNDKSMCPSRPKLCFRRLYATLEER